ncbi:MAG: hypothetical protein R3236_07830, partial [Phycisphaeraceae bacterium]|nr:hypothetical protein [Phycisphaeraceae bacterium]
TIVAPLACFLAVIEGLKCHVVTVNDYLVQRDRDWVFPAFYKLGVTVGAIHPFHMQEGEKKKEAYDCDITYGTNSEFGFDFLRDNMKLAAEDQVQKQRDFCIVDEIDSILIDEARTPLIISGPAHDDAPQYLRANKVAEQLILLQKGANQDTAKRLQTEDFDKQQAAVHKVPVAQIQKVIAKFKDLGPEFLDEKEAEQIGHVQYFVVKKESKQASMTHIGVEEAQKIVGVRFYVVGNDMAWDHLINNAVRAHAVYEKDREYVVQDGKVIIVDESTGRLMIGRQWSDGLHQAIEAKEARHGVKIEEETQTLATVTIQNFFKLYKRLAGMTGTAITEAHEFNEIYKLDVICIPTNRPVIRNDADDLIFLNQPAKWKAIIEEIRKTHDLGRPVLVGTTSVEKSELLSQMLSKKHNVPHEVLNAKQHEREASIVETAGHLGAVVIATNMAGRGTDIKLGSIDRSTLINHWKSRRILPQRASEQMADQELIGLAHRHMAEHVLGLKQKELNDLEDDQVRLRLMRHWCEKEALIKPSRAERLSATECEQILDGVPSFILHRLAIFDHIEQLGGLHIVGTERHEARRIDNQLRGRAGRQGDRGSSRFFISMEDDLMKMFAGKTTMKALSMLGMQEDDAIEHRWVTKSVEKAQTKVEQRNFQIRKSLLEYDEVMEYQRTAFYATRQSVLEGEAVKELIFDYIAESIEDAVGRYLGPEYVATRAAEAARTILGAYVDPNKLRGETLQEVESAIRSDAKADVGQDIEKSVGEYMSDEIDPRDWDVKGLASWAMSRFSVDLKHSKLRESAPPQVIEQLTETAHELIDRKNLESLSKFYEKNYAQNELAVWAREKFGLELTAEELRPETGERLPDTHQRVAELIYERAESAYRRREIEYPPQFMLEMVTEA